MMMEKLVERLAGETEVLGENLPQCRFVHHKPISALTTIWRSVCPDQIILLYVINKYETNACLLTAKL
jgi:hypothetical protein